MGRVILFALVIVALVLVWKAFGPDTWGGDGTRTDRLNRFGGAGNARRFLGQVDSETPYPEIKGPDDDEQFLWELDKKRFKERRAREQEAERRREEQLREKRRQRDQRDK